MSQTPRAADLLVEGAFVITMDPDRRIFSDGAVAIGGGRILSVGKRSELSSSYQAKRRIQGDGKVVIPGLVNSHSHFFPFVRGAIPEGCSADFVRSHYLYPFFEDLSAEEEIAGAKARMWEMLRTGTTCFADGGCKHLHHVAQAVEKMGLRGTLGRWRCDMAENGSAPEKGQGVPIRTEKALEELEEELSRRSGTSDRIRVAAMLVDEKIATESLLRGAKELASRYETILSLDVAVTKETGDQTLRKNGLRPVQRLKEAGVLGPGVLLNHATDLDPTDVSAITETDTEVCWTPSAALRRGHGTTQTGKMPELMKAGVGVALGTDGPASSDYADMVRVMYLAATLPVDSRIDHSAGSAEKALEMATIHGARALGLSEEIGSLEVGKMADLVLMDTKRPEWRPLFNVVNNLVYSATGDSVKTVIVDGRILLDDGRLTVTDEEALLETAKTLRRKMIQRLAQYPA